MERKLDRIIVFGVDEATGKRVGEIARGRGRKVRVEMGTEEGCGFLEMARMKKEGTPYDLAITGFKGEMLWVAINSIRQYVSWDVPIILLSDGRESKRELKALEDCYVTLVPKADLYSDPVRVEETIRRALEKSKNVKRKRPKGKRTFGIGPVKPGRIRGDAEYFRFPKKCDGLQVGLPVHERIKQDPRKALRAFG
ncbi:MAG: hypothetical protein AB1468_03275 [Candidatus Micrarchaeota archaeon]